MRDIVLFLSAQMDDYLRRVKSKMIAEAILDLPVIIQGGHWDHIDFGRRKAPNWSRARTSLPPTECMATN